MSMDDYQGGEPPVPPVLPQYISFNKFEDPSLSVNVKKHSVARWCQVLG